jgi:hypothetical protein
MFTQLRRDITSRGQHLHEEFSRTRSQLRQVRDEYHLAKAERPRCVDRLSGLVARYNGITLYGDRIEYARQVRPLRGVRADVGESTTDPVHPSDGGAVRDVFLTISGPDWEWTIKTVAVISSRRVRSFAAVVNSHSLPVSPAAPERTSPVASSTGQFCVLSQLRERGVLTEQEFRTALTRVSPAKS